MHHLANLSHKLGPQPEAPILLAKLQDVVGVDLLVSQNRGLGDTLCMYICIYVYIYIIYFSMNTWGHIDTVDGGDLAPQRALRYKEHRLVQHVLHQQYYRGHPSASLCNALRAM